MNSFIATFRRRRHDRSERCLAAAAWSLRYFTSHLSSHESPLLAESCVPAIPLLVDLLSASPGKSVSIADLVTRASLQAAASWALCRCYISAMHLCSRLAHLAISCCDNDVQHCRGLAKLHANRGLGGDLATGAPPARVPRGRARCTCACPSRPRGGPGGRPRFCWASRACW